MRYKLPPEWKAIRLKARMRVKNLQLGENFGANARITPIFENDMGERVGGYPRLLDLKKDSEWTTLEVVNPIPQGATLLHLQPGVLGPGGILDVDDIDLEDASSDDLPSLPIVAGLPGGAFEDLNDEGWPHGWLKGNGKAENFAIVEENGNHILRLTSDDFKYIVTEARFKLPANWRGMTVSARLRGKNIQQKPNARGWESARLGFAFENARGQRAGGFQRSLEVHNDTDWKTLSVKADVPTDALYIKVSAILQDTRGTLDIDDIRLEEAIPDVVRPQVHEINAGFPEGTFEYQDQNGKPSGWKLQGEQMQIVQEDDNRFLRLTNNDAQNTVVLASHFALKPQLESGMGASASAWQKPQEWSQPRGQGGFANPLFERAGRNVAADPCAANS